MIEVRGDDVVLTVDIRYPVSFTAEQVTELVRHGMNGYKVEAVGGKAPIYTDRDGAIIRTLSDVYRAHTGDTAEPFVMGGGTYARAMPKIVAFGPMFPDSPETEHQKNEYMREKDMISARKIYEDAIEKLANL